MKLAIVGSRSFTDYERFRELLKDFSIENKELASKVDSFISGGARGTDSLAESLAKHLDLPIEIIQARWDVYGRSAGMIRNKELVSKCDYLIAFWDGKSKGTANSIELCKQLGKPYSVIRI
jgi:RNAse (barnase) inhibitor barstar